MSRQVARIVYQFRLGINADMGLLAKVPRVSIFTVVHLRVLCLGFVLVQCRRCEQRGICCDASFEQQAAVGQKVDGVLWIAKTDFP